MSSFTTTFRVYTLCITQSFPLPQMLIHVPLTSVLQDKQNFLSSPPPGVEFCFDYAVSYPLAQLMLEEDENLKAMRFELVPKQYVRDDALRAIHL